MSASMSCNPEVLTEAEAHAAERRKLEVAPDAPLAALCLSGGGIRSAAFCLGALQALAASSLLGHFHYLSTVSGGGYAGGWLTRCLCAKAEAEAEAAAKATHTPVKHGHVKIADVEEHVLTWEGPQAPEQIRNLRRRARFLAPRSGLLSNDTWAGVMLWLRNTLINWIVFAPLMLAGAALAVAWLALVCWRGAPDGAGGLLATGQGGDWQDWRGGLDRSRDWSRNWEWIAASWGITAALAVPALLGLGVAVRRAIVNLPSHAFPDTLARMPRDASSLGWDGAGVRRGIVLPALLWTALAPLCAAPALRLPEAARAGTPVAGTFIGPLASSPKAAATASLAVSFSMAAPPAAGSPAAAPSPLLATATPVVESGFVATQATEDAETSGTTVPWREHALLALPVLLPVLSWVVCLIAYLLAWIDVRRTYHLVSGQSDWEEQNENRKQQLGPFWSNLPAWVVSAAASSALLWLGIRLAHGQAALLLALAGPPWVIACEVLRSSLYVALRRRGLRSNLDREWLARLSGAKLRPVLCFAAAAAAALVLPRLLLDSTGLAWRWVVALAGFAAGPVAALLGKSALTRAITDRASGPSAWPRPELLTSAAVSVFALALMMLSGRLATLLSLWLMSCLAPPATGFGSLAVTAGVAAMAGVVFCYAFGECVNLNRFSMHAVYRNRLVRAFLGGARADDRRRPDAYTGFDPDDDVRVANTFEGREPPMLFPVINVALNRTTGIDTARAERKAESFTITPLHCGSPSLRVRAAKAAPLADADAAPEREPHGAYVATCGYAGADKETGPEDDACGIRLGTAMAISGAAASPDMGYRSSPFTAFVMTLFNVRLGAWLPNPAAAHPTRTLMESAGPRNAVSTLLDELAGRSGVEGDYVCLSDGGHFDNLGLYEMLRRRCRLIVVVDAGRDPDYGYFDLGRALQHALVDRGVKVEFLRPLLPRRTSLEAYGAYAEITYPASAPKDAPAQEETQGQLLYLKPWLPKDAPTALHAFRAVNPSFPHCSTLNQFFTESDFESYRALGEFLVKRAVDGADTLQDANHAELARLFSGLRQRAKSPLRAAAE